MGGQDEGDTGKHGGSQGRDELTRGVLKGRNNCKDETVDFWTHTKYKINLVKNLVERAVEAMVLAIDDDRGPFHGSRR